jgi:hypothetical protein
LSQVFVFLGPTMPVAQAREHLDAVFLPPVVMGDVHRLVARRPRAIAIVDGCFQRTPAVWHKEILHALDEGIPVYGAASMGALRAAELTTFGMRGVGRIYQAYRDGRLEDDDEVALAHGDAEDGYRPLSEPMVNVRYALETARDEGLIGADRCERLIRFAKTLYYPDRCWPALFAQARLEGFPAGELEALVARLSRPDRPDLKRQDTLLLFEELRASAETSAAPGRQFVLERSIFWQRMVDATRSSTLAPGAPSPGDIAGRLRQRGVGPHLQTALLLKLVQAEAARRSVSLPEEERPRAEATFRRRRGLLSAADTASWLEANGMDLPHLAMLAEAEWLCDALIGRLGGELDGWLVAALQMSGELPALLAGEAATPSRPRSGRVRGLRAGAASRGAAGPGAPGASPDTSPAAPGVPATTVRTRAR